MNLEYISRKIQSILNNSTATGNPLAREGFYFYVATDGYYLDKISDNSLKKNIIPVFVGYHSGEITPVPNLDETDYNVNVSVYFPIIYKEKFYKLERYLKTTFVGKIVDFGHGQTVSEDPDEKIANALCNISVPTFTTIADAGLIEFKNWTSTTYGMAIDTANFWMQMNFALYTSTINGLGQSNGFAYGNEVTTTLSFSGLIAQTSENVVKIGSDSYIKNYILNRIVSSTQYYGFQNVAIKTDIVYTTFQNPLSGNSYYRYENNAMVLKGTITIETISLENEPIITTNPSIQSQSDPNAQQLLGEKETEGLAINTSYSSGFNCYFKKDVFFYVLLREWFNGNMQNFPFKIEIELDGFKYIRTCYLQSAMFNPTLGEPITFTFTFIKKVA